MFVLSMFSHCTAIVRKHSLWVISNESTLLQSWNEKERAVPNNDFRSPASILVESSIN